MQGINPIGLCASWVDTYLHNWKPTYLNHQNQLDEFLMIDLKPVNQLMTASEITEPSPSPLPSKNLWGEQRCMSSLDTANRQFANIPKDKFKDQWALIQWMKYTQVKNQQNKAWTNNLKYIFDQSKQYIDANKYEQPNVTLSKTFHKPARKAKLYAQFGYGP